MKNQFFLLFLFLSTSLLFPVTKVHNPDGTIVYQCDHCDETYELINTANIHELLTHPAVETKQPSSDHLYRREQTEETPSDHSKLHLKPLLINEDAQKPRQRPKAYHLQKPINELSPAKNIINAKYAENLLPNQVTSKDTTELTLAKNLLNAKYAQNLLAH